MTSNPLKSQQGQALIEYILVMFVTLTLIGGVIYQLNTAFATWANNYFGEYFACLIETGELPAMGGIGGTAGICNEAFEPFDLAKGRPLIAGQGIGEGGGASSSDSLRNSQDQSNAAAEGNGGASAGRMGASFGRFSRGRDGKSEKFSANLGKEANEYTGSSEAGLPGGVGSVSSSDVETKNIDRVVGGFEAGDEQGKEREKAIKAPKKVETGTKKTSRTETFKMSVPKPKAIDDDRGFEISGFGDFLKYLFIFGILILLIVFLGGQLLQIKKSME